MKRFFLLSGLILLLSSLCEAQPLWQFFNSSNSALPNNTIRLIKKASDGKMWVGTDNGLAIYDGSQWQLMTPGSGTIPGASVRAIAFHPDSSVWIGSLNEGLGIMDRNGQWTYYNTSNSSLPENHVTCIAFDSLGRAWVGTTGGIVFMDGQDWSVYNMFNSPIFSNNITNVYLDSTDVKWFTSINGGVIKRSGNQWEDILVNNSDLPDNTQFEVKPDPIGNLWFTTPGGGVARYNGSTWFVRNTINSFIPSNNTRGLYIREDNVKYISTRDTGLIRWSNGLEFDLFHRGNSSLPTNSLTVLEADNSGRIWIGTDNEGIVVLSDTLSELVSGNTELLQETSMMLYPNPARDELWLETHGQRIEWKLFTADGRTIRQGISQSPKSLIQLYGLQEGLCFIRLRNADGITEVKRIMIGF